MKPRVFLCISLSITLLLSTWMFFFVKLRVSEFTLNFLGDIIDVLHPVSANIESDIQLDHQTLADPASDKVVSATASHDSPLWESYEKSFDIFRQTYVISLPHRTDRRISMERLRQATSSNWTYVNAVTAEDATVSWLVDCVRSVREGKTVLSDAKPEEFAWPESADLDVDLPLANMPTLQASSWCPLQQMPPLDSPEPQAYDESLDLSPERRPLTCATRNLTDGPLYTPALPPYMLLTPAKVACWHSHLQVLEHIARGPEIVNDEHPDIALILEDDVDMERDVRERLRYVWEFLPASWDMVFLGHCWSDEENYPAIATLSPADLRHRATTLHPSFAPKCTHAYAVTRAGALKLVQHLSHPPFAYSRALDQAFSWLILSKKIESYSVVPSIVVQRKVSRSDIDGGGSGLGSDWRETLDDGILSA